MLSWAISSFGNKFYLKKRSRLIEASDNRFYVKFMQLEIGLLNSPSEKFQYDCNIVDTFETIVHFIQGVSKYFLKYRECCIDDVQSIRYCTPCVRAEKELCVPSFLANLSVFYVVDGLKWDLIICFNALMLLVKTM